MKALIYQGPGKKSLDDRSLPEIIYSTDAVIKITKLQFAALIFIFLKGTYQHANLAEFLAMKV